MRSAVLLLISRLFCRALETVEEETLAILAISLMEVGLCTGVHRRCTRLQCQIVLQTPFPAHPFSRKLADNWFRFDFFTSPRSRKFANRGSFLLQRCRPPSDQLAVICSDIRDVRR